MRRIVSLVSRGLLLAAGLSLVPASASAQQMALIPTPTLKTPVERPRGEDATRMLEQQLASGSVVLLGDTHHNTQILGYLADTLPRLVRTGALTHLALEIGSDQQPAVDRFFATGEGLEDIQILPAIDHPSYRGLLSTLQKSQRRNKRKLEVIAMDAPRTLLNVSRDEHMARHLASAVSQAPQARVLALVGSIHTMKSVTWVGGAPGRFIPDYLRMIAPMVKTFSIHQCVQSELPDELRPVLNSEVPSHSRPRGYRANHPALSRLQDDTLAILNLEPGHGLEDGVDGVIFYPAP